MKKGKSVSTLYILLVCLIPIVYISYNFYLTYKIGAGDMSGIYTNLQGVTYLFVYYAATLMGNYSLAKDNKKTMLYVFLLIQMVCIIMYILNIYVEFTLLASLDILVLTIPFVTGMVQNINIKN